MDFVSAHSGHSSAKRTGAAEGNSTEVQQSIGTRWHSEWVQLVAAKLAAMHQLLPKIASVPADAKTASVFRNIDTWCSLAQQASPAPLATTRARTATGTAALLVACAASVAQSVARRSTRLHCCRCRLRMT